MTYAIIYAENADIAGSYATMAEALRALSSIVAEHPELAYDVGIRPYDAGRPAGDFRPATDVLRG